jgi:hypothetical protein
MLMHFTPGFESQARARAVVDTDVVVPPPPLVELDERVVLGDEPRGGNVTPELLLSPPHDAPTSAEMTTAKANGHQRRRRGPVDATERSTSSRYRFAAIGWWSSTTGRHQAEAGAPDAFAARALRSDFARVTARQARPPW